MAHWKFTHPSHFWNFLFILRAKRRIEAGFPSSPLLTPQDLRVDVRHQLPLSPNGWLYTPKTRCQKLLLRSRANLLSSLRQERLQTVSCNLINFYFMAHLILHFRFIVRRRERSPPWDPANAECATKADWAAPDSDLPAECRQERVDHRSEMARQQQQHYPGQAVSFLLNFQRGEGLACFPHNLLI